VGYFTDIICNNIIIKLKSFQFKLLEKALPKISFPTKNKLSPPKISFPRQKLIFGKAFFKSLKLKYFSFQTREIN